VEAAQASFFDKPEKIIESWKDALAGEREEPYFKELLAKIEQERAAGKTIYPANGDVFNALQFTPFDKVKVVVIGQDPYHGPGQAHGLSFSVKQGVRPPPSLENIFKEIASDLNLPRPNHGCLEHWARQGVLLLNAVLTVEAGKPQSHREWGWERFTDRIISSLNQHKQGLIFLLWGSQAQKKGSIIDRTKHHVLTSTHPSPRSAHRGFLGCKHFSKANELLRSKGLQEIDWKLP